MFQDPVVLSQNCTEASKQEVTTFLAHVPVEKELGLELWIPQTEDAPLLTNTGRERLPKRLRRLQYPYISKETMLIAFLISLFEKDDKTEQGEPENGEESSSYQRKGRLCCRGACDMRYAVIIVNLLFPIILNCSMLGATYARIESTRDDVQEAVPVTDALKEQEDALDDLWKTTVILVAIGAGIALIAIIGALRFNKYLVLPNAIYVPAAFVVTLLINFDTADTVPEYDYHAGFFMGPLVGALISPVTHIVFIREIKAGIMTKENYENEQYCCCV